MNVAAKALQGNKLAFDPSLDVNETAAIVLAAKRGVAKGKKQGKQKGRSAVFILGGGSPKNFSCKLNLKSRRCWELMKEVMTTFCR
jgi:deoxyhypusine synthase